MALKSGSIVTTDDYLRANDHIHSPCGFFFAIQQGDANFCTYNWSDSLGISIGVKTTFECGVPLIAEGKAEVSAAASDTYTWNGSESRSTT